MLSFRSATCAVLVTVAASIAFSSPAYAHSDTGSIEVLQEGVGAGQAGFQIAITYEDGESVEASTASASALGPNGETLGPVPVATSTEDGVYEFGFSDLAAGEWTFEVTSQDPVATLKFTAEVAPSDATTPTTTSGAPETTDPTTSEPATSVPNAPEQPVTTSSVPGTNTTALVPVVLPEPSEFPVVPVATGLAVAAMAAVVATYFLRRP